MDGRRILGGLLVLAGAACILLGVFSALAQRSGIPMPSSQMPLPGTAAPATIMSATPPATVGPPTVAAATAAPTQDAHGLIRSFISTLEAAVRDGEQETVVANLGKATIDRYGLPACEEYLASRDPSPEQAFEILSISGPAPWDYPTDGLTTTVPNAYTLQARVTGPNASGEVSTSDAELHVSIGDGTVFWYTDCGMPLPGQR